MKLIVISNPVNLNNEHVILCSLFEAGLECFHVYKPLFSKEEIQNYIQGIPSVYHSKIVLHSEYFKFHSLKELEECKEKYEYAFLSPVFDSISKQGYKGKFDLQELKNSPLLRREAGGEIIALGGIDEYTIAEAISVGFKGVAVLGAVWMSDDPLKKFKELKRSLEAVNKNKIVHHA